MSSCHLLQVNGLSWWIVIYLIHIAWGLNRMNTEVIDSKTRWSTVIDHFKNDVICTSHLKVYCLIPKIPLIWFLLSSTTPQYIFLWMFKSCCFCKVGTLYFWLTHWWRWFLSSPPYIGDQEAGKQEINTLLKVYPNQEANSGKLFILEGLESLTYSCEEIKQHIILELRTLYHFAVTLSKSYFSFLMEVASCLHSYIHCLEKHSVLCSSSSEGLPRATQREMAIGDFIAYKHIMLADCLRHPQRQTLFFSDGLFFENILFAVVL